MDRLRARLIPALLTALGVTFLAAGLLDYTGGVAADDPNASPGGQALLGSGDPSASDPLLPSLPTLPTITLPPLSSPSVTPTPSPTPTASPGGGRRVATRISYPALGIDLPIIRQPDPSYPSCNVAMYLEAGVFGQPGGSKPTYIYGHARTGMLLPILTQSKINNGAAMIGDIIEIYTGDDMRFLYQVFAVHRHVRTLDAAMSVHADQLWVQTSEGPNHTYPKLQIVAKPLSSERVDHAAAHPKPHPVNCA
jgi:hypothetical protein